MPERIILVDSNSLIYRGYFAIPPLTTTKGELSNATFGFASILLKAIEEIKPQHIAAALDLPTKTFRHEADATYKATRKPMPDELRPQFERVKEILDRFAVPMYSVPGYEADDVIGALSRQADAAGLEAIIVSGLPVTLEIDRTKWRGYDRAAVLDLFRDLEFRSLIPRLPPADANLAAAPARVAARPGQLALGLEPEPNTAPPVETTLIDAA